jgi:hypothetical protein
MGSGRPVITLAPVGAVTKVVEDTRSGRCARSSDIPGIADIVLDMYRQWQEGKLGSDQRRELVRQFERREVTRHLASLLDELTEAESKEPRA